MVTVRSMKLSAFHAPPPLYLSKTINFKPRSCNKFEGDCQLIITANGTKTKCLAALPQNVLLCLQRLLFGDGAFGQILYVYGRGATKKRRLSGLNL